jgi:Uma2 family endonuclease
MPVAPSASPEPVVRHKRAPAPIHFPAEAEMPETKRHLKLRTLLFAVLETFADRASVGSEQLIYWAPTEPAKCLAPNAFLRLDAPDTDFNTWKTWERGAPELAVEIVSDSDASDRAFDEKVRRYHEMGVRELVRFDPDAPAGARIRAWDLVQGDLVERVVEGDRTPCSTLGLWWVVVPGAGYPAALRLARDAAGADLVLTSEEKEVRAREAAEQKVAELEAKLAQRGG